MLPTRNEEVAPTVSAVQLAGYLAVPEGAPGGGLRPRQPQQQAQRNRHVADMLNDAGLGMQLFDLLIPEEEPDWANVFDIGLLVGRFGPGGWMAAPPDMVTAFTARPALAVRFSDAPALGVVMAAADGMRPART